MGGDYILDESVEREELNYTVGLMDFLGIRIFNSYLGPVQIYLE
jgi:hypothetical protein